MSSTVGLIMLGTAVAMFILARPRHGVVVPWLRNDTSQWLYVMTIVFLLGVGFSVALMGR